MARRQRRQRGNPLGTIATSFISGLGAGAGFTAVRAALGAAGTEQLAEGKMRNPIRAGDVVTLGPQAARVFGDTQARVVGVTGGGLFGGPARVELVTPAGVRGTIGAGAVKQSNPRGRFSVGRGTNKLLVQRDPGLAAIYGVDDAPWIVMDQDGDIKGFAYTAAEARFRAQALLPSAREQSNPDGGSVVLWGWQDSRQEWQPVGQWSDIGPALRAQHHFDLYGVRTQITKEPRRLDLQAIGQRIGDLRRVFNPITAGEERILYLPQDAYHGNLIEVTTTGRWRVPPHVAPKDAGRAREYEVLIKSGTDAGRRGWFKSFQLLHPERVRGRPLEPVGRGGAGARNPGWRDALGDLQDLTERDLYVARIAGEGFGVFPFSPPRPYGGVGPDPGQEPPLGVGRTVTQAVRDAGRRLTRTPKTRGNPARYNFTVRTFRPPAARRVQQVVERYGGEAEIRPFADEYGHRYLVGVTKRPAEEAVREIARKFNPVSASASAAAANPMNVQLAAARTRFNALVKAELARLHALPGSARAKFRLAALRAKARYRAGE